MSTTACSVSCGIVETQLGRLESPITWAEKYLVREGYVKRRTKLKKLSAKKIAEIIDDLETAKTDLENHECGNCYDDY